MARLSFSANSAWYLANFRISTIQSFLQEGHEVWVLCPDGPGIDALREAGARWMPLPVDAKGSNPLRDLGTISAYHGAYRKIRPAIAFHFTVKPNLYGSIAARMAGAVPVNNVTGVGAMFEGRFRSLAVGLLCRLALGSSRGWTFFQNTHDHGEFLDRKLVRRERTSVIPGSGVDLDRFLPVPKPPRKPLVALYSGRLLKAKGLPVLLEAMEMLRFRGFGSDRIVLTVLGGLDDNDPASVDRCQLDAAVAAGLCEYRGHVADPEAWLSRAHVLVHPSWYREGVPRCMLEALASGTPIVGADSPGTREPVTPGSTGWLVPPGDATALADVLMSVISMEEEAYTALCLQARMRAETVYDQKLVVEAYRRIAEGLLGTGS